MSDVEQRALQIVTSGDLANLDRQGIRELLTELEAKFSTYPQIDVPIAHHFSSGVYAREMAVPAGSLIIGKIHRKKNMNIISKGEVSVLSIDGVERKKAPYTFVASPGAKRLIYAHEDTVWTTIHGTDEKDLGRLEEEFIAKDYEDLYLGTGRTFDDVLMVLGGTPEEVTAISQNESDLVPFQEANYPIQVKDSPIHGQGLFATRDVSQGEIIAPARLQGMRTPAGKYANHSANPNAKMVMRSDGNVDLIALELIEHGREILTDYFYNYQNTRSACHG